MLKFVQDIFHFKIAWKLRLKCFYFFAKVHGLAHFTYVEKIPEVSFSFMSTVYGWVWIVGYFLLLVLALISLNEVVDDSDGSSTLFFVNATEIVTILLKAFSIYFLQVIQSKDLVLLINDAIAIKQLINYERRKITNAGSRRFARLYNLKKWCVLLQFALFFMSFYMYAEQSSDDAIELVFGFFIAYTHFSTVVVSGLFFYGSLLFAYEFYYSLNRQLIQILKKVEMNSKFRTQMESFSRCDELDGISLVYTRINSYFANINRLFAVQITFELFGSFVMITCALFYIFYALLSSQESVGSDAALWEEPLYEILNSMMYCAVYFAEIYTISHISNTVTDEAVKLSTYLHKSVFVNADKRFVRSVQQLSLKAFFEKPEISPMRMFIIDRSLMIGIGATIATYLVILIQFQINRKQ